MWRHRADCNHCNQASAWRLDREKTRQEIRRHLAEFHALGEPREAVDYRMSRERQCDYCLEPYLDHCTKCNRDFSASHAGDIDGLCGGCI